MIFLSTASLFQPLGWLNLLPQVVVVSYPFHFLASQGVNKYHGVRTATSIKTSFNTIVNIATFLFLEKTQPASNSTIVNDKLFFGQPL